MLDDRRSQPQSRRRGSAGDKRPLIDNYRSLASLDGMLYDSRSGLANLYRYHPRSPRTLISVTASGPRPLLHDSVVMRMVEGNDYYASVAVDAEVDVLTEDNVALAFKPASDSGGDMSSRRAVIQGAIDRCLSGSQRSDRDAYISRGLDFVWWRRVLYYIALGHVILLAAFPLYSSHALTLLAAIPGMSPDLVNSLATFVLSPIFLVLRFATPALAEPRIAGYEGQT